MAKTEIITCRKCGMPLVKGTKVCSYCNKRARYLFNRAPREKQVRGIHIGSHVIPIPWVSLILILLNAVAGIYKLAGGELDIILKYGMIQGSLQKGEWYRLITGSFLHIAMFHFASNMYALVIYGFVLENKIGKWKYLLIYLFSMFGSSLLINFIGGTAIHIGASGAIWGLMAANLLYCIYTRKLIYLLYAVLSVAGNIIYTFSSGISWQGHFGGAIAGAVLALILFANERKNRH